ncbi:MAG: OadG family transporter subunit [Bacteroidales bacterium]
MNNSRIGQSIYIFMFLLLIIGCSSCNEQKEDSTSKILINEVLIDNKTNFQDDYGVQGPWIELFNKSYGSVDLAGFHIAASFTPGDTIKYFIPKGDVLTLIKPRQHALFWADGQPNHGTFHMNFRLDTIGSVWIGLYDQGKKLLDSIVIDNSIIGTDNSYGRVTDAGQKWEVKGTGEDNYITPSTNNKTIGKSPKITKFEEHDSEGIGMSITAMSVVFVGLIILFLAFKLVGNVSVKQSKKRALKSQGLTSVKNADKSGIEETSGEVFAAIAMAIHELHDNVHDIEETVLTINKVKRSYSPWSSKIYGLRETPQKNNNLKNS